MTNIALKAAVAAFILCGPASSQPSDMDLHRAFVLCRQHYVSASHLPGATKEGYLPGFEQCTKIEQEHERRAVAKPAPDPTAKSVADGAAIKAVADQVPQ